MVVEWAAVTVVRWVAVLVKQLGTNLVDPLVSPTGLELELL